MLGADGDHRQQPGAAQVPGEVVDELDGRLPGVLQVIHDEQRGAVRSQPRQQGGHRLERPAPFHVRAAPPGRWRPEQRRGLGQQGRRGGGVLAEQVAQRGRRHPADGRGHRLHDRLQEKRPLGLIAARAQHGRAVIGGLSRKVLGECRLPDPGLTDDHDEAGIRGDGAAPGSVQGRGLGIPAGQRGPAVHRCPRAGAGRCLAGAGRRAARQVSTLIAQDSQVQILCLGRRVGPQFFGQAGAQRRIGGQRLGRLTGRGRG